MLIEIYKGMNYVMNYANFVNSLKVYEKAQHAYSFERFLNENVDSQKRSMIYQKIKAKGLYVYPELDQFISKLLHQRIIRRDLGKLMDRIIANFCRMLILEYKGYLQYELESYDSEDHEAIEFLQKLEFVTGKNIADTNKVKNDVTFDIENLYLNYADEGYHIDAVFDYLNSPLRDTNEAIAWDTITFLELNQKAEHFHDQISDLAGEKIISNDIGGQVIYKISDNLMWIDLQTNSSKDEARIMGHCGNDSNATTLYSLRKITEVGGQYIMEPLVTASVKINTYNENTVTVLLQMKGKANTKPKAEYHPYIVDLLIHSEINIINTHSGYKPESNFQIYDLNDTLTAKLLSKNPVCYDNLYNESKQDLDKALDHLLKLNSYIEYIQSLPENAIQKIIGRKINNVFVVYYINRQVRLNGEPTKNGLNIVRYIVDGIEEPEDMYDYNGDETNDYLDWFAEIKKLPIKKWAERLGVDIYSY